MSMAGKKYALEFLPQFEEDMREAVDYIRLTLRNPMAADKLFLHAHCRQLTFEL